MTKVIPKKKAGPPKESILTFKEFRVVELTYSLNSEFKGEWDGEVSPDFQTSYDYFKEVNSLLVLIKISQKSKDIPYFLEVVCGGMFSFDEPPAQDNIERLARINCSAIIFPYVRETVADLTRRGGFAPLHLPPINFVNLYNQEPVKKRVKGKKKTPIKSK